MTAGLPERVIRAFRERFDAPPAFVARAPGRVNLIGDHTDYNDGFVLPLAIERAVWIALRPRPDRRVVLSSATFGDATLDLDTPDAPAADWTAYVAGTAWALEQAGHRLGGWEGTLDSDVPIGAGLSSSAALELATARGFAAVSGIEWDAVAMARVAQRAENDRVGVSCGIMDQMISAVGRAGHAVLIDCRSLDTQPVPLPADTVVVILDTATRRGLVDSAYNERRARCEAAAAYFGVPALRDVSHADLEAATGAGAGGGTGVAATGSERSGLDEVTARRARHVVTENARTTAAAGALRRGDAATVGTLMNQSHDSLRDDFEVSSGALDTMVRIARRLPGCLGARMTGGGFGGCAVALVEADAASSFAEAVASRYEHETGVAPAIHPTGASDGASLVLP